VAGISPGDELVAIDRFRATSDGELRTLLGARKPTESIMVTLFRRHRLVDAKVTLAAAPPTRYELVGTADPGAGARYQAWLGEAHPGAQSLATITTTARWV
jgi:predicted metalloprotease with PDZ domain